MSLREHLTHPLQFIRLKGSSTKSADSVT